MAHRGRLNVLANIIGKSPHEIFREFADHRSRAAPRPRRREVSPGLQQRLDHRRRGRRSTCRCASIPATWNSSTRWPSAACAPSRTAPATSSARTTMALLIHGDAAFAGEGIVQETLNLSQLRGYQHRRHAARHRQQPDRLHHLARPKAARAPTPPTWPRCCKSRSSTSTAKIPRPWRRSCGWRWISADEFQRDVVIDMYCYRRRGHNEGDEPAFTQPRAVPGDREAQDRPRRLSRAPAAAGRDHARRGRPDRRRAAASSSSRSCRSPRSDEYVPARRRSGGVWKGYVGGRERDVAGRRHRRRPRERWPSCSKRRRSCRPTFIRIPRSSGCSKRAAKWPTASGRSIGPPAEALAFASLADRRAIASA